MNSIAATLRSRRWESVPHEADVTPVTPPAFPTTKPKEDSAYSSFGLPTPKNAHASAVTQKGGAKLADPPRLVLDFETYYDSKFSLKNLSIPVYIYDKRFKVHGLAVKHPNGECEFRTDVEALLSKLKSEYGQRLEKATVVMHNAYFDYSILKWHYSLEVENIIDTMLLSRLLNGADEEHTLRALANRYGLPDKGDLDFMSGVKRPDAYQLGQLREYAINDVEITDGLADVMLPIAQKYHIEMWAAQHSVKMFAERPLSVDGAGVDSALEQLESTISVLVAASGLDIASIRSTKRFPEALEKALAKTGRKLPTKPGKRGPIAAISKNDPAREELLNDSDSEVRALMQAKAAVNSSANSRSRLEKLSSIARLTGGSGYFMHSYYRANTGRFAGGDGFNIQNLKHGIGDDTASLTRRAIGALSGMALCSADASQIEARVLAYLAGQNDLHDAFAKGCDVYSEFASRQFHREVRKPRDGDNPEYADELKRHRQIGKQAILGLGFGMGANGFIHNLQTKPDIRPLFDSGMLSGSVCARIVYGYRDAYPEIKQFWTDCENAALQAIDGTPATVSGMKFYKKGSTLYIKLRSARRLVYPNSRLMSPTYEEFTYLDRYGIEQSGTHDKPRIVYGRGIELYGGKIVENIVQGTARDILVDVMYRIEQCGLPVIHHCHDSITVSVPEEQTEIAPEQLLSTWRAVPAWAAGLALDAETKCGTTLESV